MPRVVLYMLEQLETAAMLACRKGNVAMQIWGSRRKQLRAAEELVR